MTELFSENPREARLGAGLLVLLALAAYLPAIQGGFLWDDRLLVTDNVCVRLADGWWRAWVTPASPDYFPLTISSFWAEWRLWGEGPRGYHVTNILLHALNGVLLWGVLRQLRVRWAWIAAGLFVLHPVAVPSVAWISERKNVLSLLFYLLSIAAFLRFDDAGRRRWYAAALACFALALCAKSAVVMLPGVLLLCVLWRRRTLTRRDVWRTVPFFALALVLGLVTLWFQQQHAIHGQAVRPEGVASRLAAAGWILGFYLWKDIVPLNLTMIYPRWNVPAANPLAYLPLVLYLAALACCWHRRSGCGAPAGLALAYFGVVLLPVLGFVNMSYMKYALVADHLQYLALPAVTAFAAGGLAWLTERWPAERRTVLKPLAILLFALFGALVLHRAWLFAAGERLWTDNIAKTPNCWAAYRNLAAVYHDRGDADDAAAAARQAIALNPGDAQAHLVLGAAESLGGRQAEAVAAYREALRVDPGLKGVQYNLGIALFKLGRYAEAQAAFTIALDENPRYAGVRYWLANCAFETGDRIGAEAHLRAVIALEPRHPAAYVRLAEVLLTRPETDAAARAETGALATRAIEVGAERDWRQLDRLAAVFATLGRLPEAAQVEEAALVGAGEIPAAERHAMQARLEQYRQAPPK